MASDPGIEIFALHFLLCEMQMKKCFLSSSGAESGVFIKCSTFVLQPMLDPVILTTIQDVRSVEEKDLKDKVNLVSSQVGPSTFLSLEARPGPGARFTCHCSFGFYN